MPLSYKPILLLFFGFLPSLVWLFFYLRKDCHPEPRYLIARTFFMAILLAPLAVIAQWLFSALSSYIFSGYQASLSWLFFIWSAFIEETVKLLAVWLIVLNNTEFDEPVDTMIYLVTAGLGFAAIENILVIVQSIPQGIEMTIQLWILRFVGATLLHAVASGILGYFLALSWFYHHHSRRFLIIGLTLASLIHFAFNFTLLSFSGRPSALIYSLILLAIGSAAVSILFNKIRDRKLSTAR